MAKAHAQWRNPESKPKVGALQSSVVESVDGAASACFADECNRVLGKELLREDEKHHAELV